jgi:hypothetical protein
MKFKAARRPYRLARTATQLTDTRRSRRQVPGDRLVPVGRLTGRWAQGADGRLVLEWSLERPAQHLIDRQRGSDG